MTTKSKLKALILRDNRNFPSLSKEHFDSLECQFLGNDNSPDLARDTLYYQKKGTIKDSELCMFSPNPSTDHEGIELVGFLTVIAVENDLNTVTHQLAGKTNEVFFVKHEKQGYGLTKMADLRRIRDLNLHTHCVCDNEILVKELADGDPINLIKDLDFKTWFVFKLKK